MEQLIAKEIFTKLATAKDTPAVSIYMPLEQEVDKQDKNRIRLKNGLKHADSILQKRYHLSAQEAGDLLQPGTSLIENGRFSGELEEGLALFLSAEQSHIYALPHAFTEEVIVSSHFYIKPLLPLFTENGRFYILALSQNEIRLLQATRYAVHELILPEEVPQTLDKALKWEDPEYQLQWHTGTSASARQSRRAVFHGHGVSTGTAKKENIKEYFRQVAAGIDELLKGQSAPLVLVGVEYLLPLYRDTTQYPYLVAQELHGNPEQSSAQTLRDRAWELVAPLIAQEQEEAIKRLADHSQTDLVTDELPQIIVAAHFGQVDLLFLDEKAKMWGTLDPTLGGVQQQRAEDKDMEAQELLDRTAVHTFLNGGTVFLLPRAQIPEEAAATALLRAPVTTLV